MSRNIDWDYVLIGRPFRRFFCRVGVFFIILAGIDIKEWEEKQAR